MNIFVHRDFQNRFCSIFLKLFALMLIFINFTSCSPGSCTGKNSCCDFGRPPVLCYKSDYVINYNDCFKEIPIGWDEACMQRIQKVPLTEDMFNAFEPIDPNYRLARGDILEISIFGEEESTVEKAMIAPDGRIYYTFLDGVQAADRTPEEVAKEIETKLKHLFLNPQVSITTRESQALNYRILGRVRQPGVYPFGGPVTLREAVADAGGLITQKAKDQDYGRRYLIPYANLKDSFIVRGNKKLDVDFDKLLHEGDHSQNIYLRPDDYIYIAGYEKKEVFVLGYVNAPQRLPFVPEMTLMSAIATVGGWPTPSPYSPNLDRVMVIRGSLDCPKACVVSVNKIMCGEALDLCLEPGDIVYASHKNFRFGREMVLLAIDAFVSSFVSSAGEHYTRIHWFDMEAEDTSGGDEP